MEGLSGIGRSALRGGHVRRPPAPRSRLTALVLAGLVAILAGCAGATPVDIDSAPQGEPVEARVAAPSGQASPDRPHHGLPQSAVEIGRPGGFPITNSMVVTWITALLLIVLARTATRHMSEVPGPVQNFFEWIVQGLYEFLETIVGPHLMRRTFWFFATIFIFILASNWLGLVPGVGTIGWGHQTAQGFRVEQPLLRGANADLNMTLAMSLVFFACWIVWVFQEIGVRGAVSELFGAKGDTAGPLRVVLVVVFFAAGCLEVVSILFRPVSLSFRLYGNVFAGENMLEKMSTLVPGFGWLLPIPFYFMELMVGLVQAMVFMLLTAVFTVLICQHHDEPEPIAAHE
jgi:F-type H+-transporting ATPase subunit a